MRSLIAGVAIVPVLAATAFAQAPAGQTSAELPLHTERFSDRVLFAWAGDDMQLIRTVALSTARGVVVIEAIWEKIGGK